MISDEHVHVQIEKQCDSVSRVTLEPQSGRQQFDNVQQFFENVEQILILERIKVDGIHFPVEQGSDQWQLTCQ